MSGGSMEYLSYKIDEYLVNQMRDSEMNDLIKDVSALAHILEWVQSGDTCEEKYQEQVAEFKNKWFKGDRQIRLKSYVDEKLSETKAELYQLLGISE